MSRFGSFLTMLALLGVAISAPAGAHTLDAAPAVDAAPGSFELVGHEPLRMRGMNAALAVHGNYAYVGSRTDGKADNANGAGVLVVDVSDPTKPQVVHESVSRIRATRVRRRARCASGPSKSS